MGVRNQRCPHNRVGPAIQVAAKQVGSWDMAKYAVQSIATASMAVWLLAGGLAAVGVLLPQPAGAALLDWPANSAPDSYELSVAVGLPLTAQDAINHLAADVLEQAKAELAAAVNSMGLGIPIDPAPTEQLPASPRPQGEDRLADMLVPDSGNTTSCGGTSLAGSSGSGSAQPAAAFCPTVTVPDLLPRGRLPREASLQFSSNTLRPPTPPPRD